jgi:hypothetical protein
VTVNTIIEQADNSIVTTFTSTQSIAAETNYDFVQNTTILNPHLWNGRSDPYMYKVLVEVEVDGAVVDIVEQPLGLRYYHVDPDTGFYLNGRHYDLHGVAIHEDREDKGRAISDADRQQDIAIIMEMGCTFVRLSHYQHAEKIYDLADENGLVLWTEIPLVNQVRNITAFSNNIEQQLKELIRQNYNHPSVFFWGLYNELRTAPDPTALVYELNTLAHQEDPTRLTTAATDKDGSFTPNWIPDIIAWNRYIGWYGGSATQFVEWADNMHTSHRAAKLGISEYGAGASIYHHQENPPAPEPGGPWHPEEYQNYFHEVHWMAIKNRPYLWCKTIWNGFDFAADQRNEGDRPGINDKGVVTRDRNTKKDTYYWYKANWSNEPVIYISSRRFTPRYKNPVEVKVYSNCESVELFVNGSLKKVKSGSGCVFLWTDIKLAVGENEIKALGKKGGQEYQDICSWDFVVTNELSVSSVTASSYQRTPEVHPPQDTIDGDFSTRWAAQGDGEWIRYDLGSVNQVDKVYIAFYKGNERLAYFDIEVSTDDLQWTPVLTSEVSSGSTLELEEFDFEDVPARYIRIVGHGSSVNSWNNYTEVEIHGVIRCEDVLAAGCGLDADWSGPNSVADCYVDFFDFAAMANGWLVPEVKSIYEAEEAVLVGPTIENLHPWYTGLGYADYTYTPSGEYIEWTVNIPVQGSYSLQFRYANGSTGDRPLEVKVNNVVIKSSLSLPPTGAWATWATVSVSAGLISGHNTIRATSIGWAGPNMDHLNIVEFATVVSYDFTDLQVLGREWLECNDPQDPQCGFWK